MSIREHPSSEQLNQYQRRVLAPDMFLSIQKHIDACSVCFQQINDAKKPAKDYETLLAALVPDPLDEAYHLTKAELVGYVDATLGDLDLEVSESHLAVCTDCEQAVEELRASSSRSQKTPGEEKFAVREHRAAYFRSWPQPVLFASVLLVMLGLVVVTVILINRKARTDAGYEVSGNQQNPSQASPNTSASESASGTNPRPTPAQNPSESGPGAGISRAGAPGINSAQEEELAKLAPHLREEINSTLKTESLAQPRVLRELRGSASTLLGESDKKPLFRLLTPVGQVVQTATPVFHWQSLAAASSYVVTIADDKLNVVVRSPSLTTTEWAVPAPLKRGRVYSWQVTAIKDGQKFSSPVMPAPQAKFKILDEIHEQELVNVKRNLPNYHLGLGILYTRVGLIEEAESEFQAELQARPHSAVAQKLLQNVRSMKE